MTMRKTAIVTGASSGIGLGLATALVEHGYRVVANSRRITVAGTLAPSDDLVLVDGDIAQPHTAHELVDTAVRRFGGVDLLVNNAGIFISKPFTDYTTEDFDRLVSTNLAGFFYVTQHAVRQMRRVRSGHIVTISTTLADQPIAGGEDLLGVTRHHRYAHAQTRNARVLEIPPSHPADRHGGRDRGSGHVSDRGRVCLRRGTACGRWGSRREMVIEEIGLLKIRREENSHAVCPHTNYP